MTGFQWLLTALVVIFGFYMAWNIGANDVANAMGTSVGSRALTLTQAVVLAGIFEFLGAYFVGANVTDTVRKKIFDPTLLNDVFPAASYGEGYAATILACGMIAALMAAGSWLMFASYFGLPVSTSHTVVGAVVGFGCVSLGASMVQWKTVGLITAGWIVSPILSGAVAYTMFRYILRAVFYKRDPISAAKRVAPSLACVVLVVLVGVTGFEGMKPLWQQWGVNPFGQRPLVLITIAALATGAIGMLITRYLVQQIEAVPVANNELVTPDTSRALSKAIKHLRRARDTSEGTFSDQSRRVLDELDQLHRTVQQRVRFGTDSVELQHVERIFAFLQVITACFIAFSHGSNDVANAIGPLSAAIEAIRSGQVAMRAPVPIWTLALGGIGIVVGLATWGWRVIQTVGNHITELTPSRGFCATFSAAFVILLASILPTGLPVSTTHTMVGAVLGVGLARGIGALNLNTMRDILASWVVTIPAGAGLAIVFYYLLKLLLIDLPS